jgi:hypothetical protein
MERDRGVWGPERAEAWAAAVDAAAGEVIAPALVRAANVSVRNAVPRFPIRRAFPVIR